MFCNDRKKSNLQALLELFRIHTNVQTLCYSLSNDSFHVNNLNCYKFKLRIKSVS